MPISPYMKQLRRQIGTACVMQPAVSAMIVNERNEVLLHRSKEDGNWYVIGGACDPGEEPALTAVREAYEETGLIVRPQRVLGVFADPLVRYSNGDEVLYTATAFLCRPVGGELKIGDDESLEVRYFTRAQLPPLLPTHLIRVELALGGEKPAYYAWDESWLKNW